MNRLINEDVESELRAAFEREFPYRPSGPKPRPLTRRERLSLRIWRIRYRIANWLYPCYEDDD